MATPDAGSIDVVCQQFIDDLCVCLIGRYHMQQMTIDKILEEMQNLENASKAFGRKVHTFLNTHGYAEVNVYVSAKLGQLSYVKGHYSMYKDQSRQSVGWNVLNSTLNASMYLFSFTVQPIPTENKADVLKEATSIKLKYKKNFRPLELAINTMLKQGGRSMRVVSIPRDNPHAYHVIKLGKSMQEIIIEPDASLAMTSTALMRHKPPPFDRHRRIQFALPGTFDPIYWLLKTTDFVRIQAEVDGLTFTVKEMFEWRDAFKKRQNKPRATVVILKGQNRFFNISSIRVDLNNDVMYTGMRMFYSEMVDDRFYMKLYITDDGLAQPLYPRVQLWFLHRNCTWYERDDFIDGTID
ncbi:hypothetical protein L596_001403 [Steinernema carpocapsae]|uniref:Uncharacterized protein n=1 Tax=Steinernema carpocapsae TaxID=34508 RepID=A0A4U8ULN8_STECR|nr:hypothetical protein L596_001403 [Steinernema carpocapsae]